MKKLSFLFVLCLISMALLSSCSSSSSSSKTASNSNDTYATVGGDKTVESIVSKTLEYASNDSRTAKYLTSSTKPLVKSILTSEICNALGGPCEHSAITLKEAMRDTGFNAASGNALLESVGKSMDELTISTKTKDAAMSSLASTLLQGM